MFGFGKSKNTKTICALKNQCIGGQSLLYRLFVETLEVPDEKIRKMELTYFSLSILTYVFLRFFKGVEKEKILDDASLIILESSIPHCGESITINQAVSEYQQRYKEYNALLLPLFSKSDPNPNIILLSHFYEKVTQNTAIGAMIKISVASTLIYQYVLDNIHFVKKI